jgi:hypothetical protein
MASKISDIAKVKQKNYFSEISNKKQLLSQTALPNILLRLL